MAQLKRKVTLKKKSSEEPLDKVEQEKADVLSEKEAVESKQKDGNIKKWIGASVLIGLLVGGFYLFNSKSGDDPQIASQDLVVNSVPDEQIEKAALDSVAQNAQDQVNPESESTAQKQATQTQEKVESRDLKETAPVAIDIKNDESKSSLTGSIEEKALLVIRGNFGNGEERKLKLGSDYNVIQSKVNEMYKDGRVF